MMCQTGVTTTLSLSSSTITSSSSMSCCDCSLTSSSSMEDKAMEVSFFYVAIGVRKSTSCTSGVELQQTLSPAIFHLENNILSLFVDKRGMSTSSSSCTK